MPFFDIFASPRWSPLRMRTKVASFFIFFQELSNKKKIKALRPKMTKIASRGGGPALMPTTPLNPLFLVLMLLYVASQLRKAPLADLRMLNSSKHCYVCLGWSSAESRGFPHTNMMTWQPIMWKRMPLMKIVLLRVYHLVRCNRLNSLSYCIFFGCLSDGSTCNFRDHLVQVCLSMRQNLANPQCTSPSTRLGIHDIDSCTNALYWNIEDGNNSGRPVYDIVTKHK